MTFAQRSKPVLAPSMAVSEKNTKMIRQRIGQRTDRYRLNVLTVSVPGKRMSIKYM